MCAKKYDPQIIIDVLLQEVTELYNQGMSLQRIADELELNPIKVRKLLITAGVYDSSLADEVRAVYERYNVLPDDERLQKTIEETGLSHDSVDSYLPYRKAVYMAEECGVLADRIRLHRARKAAVENLKDNPDSLWECLTLFAGYPFKTSKGLKFTYSIKGNEMFVSRKEKSITRATVVLAYERSKALGDRAAGPKKLGCFGASYLYPVFVRLGVIKLPKLIENEEFDIFLDL